MTKLKDKNYSKYRLQNREILKKEARQTIKLHPSNFTLTRGGEKKT